MKAKAINSTKGTLQYYDCPKCLNKGYTATVRNGQIVLIGCECRKIRESRKLLEQSGLQGLIDQYTFETYQTPEPWQADLKAGAQRFAANPDGWFVLTGSVGSGKTHICTAICRRLIDKGLSTRYMLWVSVSKAAKAVINDEEAYRRIVEPLKKADVLYIDDLFKPTKANGQLQPPTPADISLAFEIINARYIDNKKITLISSERSLEEIGNYDEALASRIYERCKYGNLYPITASNWRLK